MRSKAPPPDTASDGLLGGILGIAGYVFIVYLFLAYPYTAFRLSRSGRAAVATVTSCEFFWKISRGTGSPRWRWEIVYDGHVAHQEYTWSVKPGRQIPVLYLPENPSVVEIGLPDDSTWTIMVKNIRGYAVVPVVIAVVIGFVIIVAPPVLLGIGVVQHYRTIRRKPATGALPRTEREGCRSRKQ